MAEPVTYKLKKPIQFGSDTITELTFKPPKFRHLKGLPAGDEMGALLLLAMRLSGQPEQVIGEMDLEDISGVAEIVGNFTEPSRRAGKPPSDS